MKRSEGKKKKIGVKFKVNIKMLFKKNLNKADEWVRPCAPTLANKPF